MGNAFSFSHLKHFLEKDTVINEVKLWEALQGDSEQQLNKALEKKSLGFFFFT